MENDTHQSQEDEDEQPTTAIDPTQSPEYLQRKLYFLLEKLKTMHAVLPEYVFAAKILFIFNKMLK